MTEELPFNSNISTTFRHDIFKELLKSKCSNPKNKISEDTVDLIVEVAKAMVIEAAARACYQANLENKSTVTLDHVECILPQMEKKPISIAKLREKQLSFLMELELPVEQQARKTQRIYLAMYYLLVNFNMITKDIILNAMLK